MLKSKNTLSILADLKEIEIIVKSFCCENGIAIVLSFDMPVGYETAYNSFARCCLISKYRKAGTMWFCTMASAIS